MPVHEMGIAIADCTVDSVSRIELEGAIFCYAMRRVLLPSGRKVTPGMVKVPLSEV